MGILVASQLAASQRRLDPTITLSFKLCSPEYITRKYCFEIFRFRVKPLYLESIANMPGEIVVGHHGTSQQIADQVLSGGFLVSKNAYDWLGDGVYFWQNAPLRALSWATKTFGTDGVVIEADIEVRDFINLLDIEWMSWLADVHDQYLVELKEKGQAPPVQTERAHRLDREVINFGIEILEQSGHSVRGVIGSFREGRPVFPNSALYSESHVQIAVRDLSLISNCRILTADEVSHARAIKHI
jgi:hypothetical protein